MKPLLKGTVYASICGAVGVALWVLIALLTGFDHALLALPIGAAMGFCMLQGVRFDADIGAAFIVGCLCVGFCLLAMVVASAVTPLEASIIELPSGTVISLNEGDSLWDRAFRGRGRFQYLLVILSGLCAGYLVASMAPDD